MVFEDGVITVYRLWQSGAYQMMKGGKHGLSDTGFRQTDEAKQRTYYETSGMSKRAGAILIRIVLGRVVSSTGV